MKKLLVILSASLLLLSSAVEAKGGMSSGGRGGFSSASRLSVNQSVSRPSQPVAQRSVTTTTVSRTYSSRVSPGMGYGGMGMGYHYSNGLMTGLIIGSMMHPHGTIMYTGYGQYAGNALLYPNGQVVDQSGRLVGTYVGGVFTPVYGGQVVAQQVPSDAMVQPVIQPQPQPIVVHDSSFTIMLLMLMFIFILMVFLF